MKKFQDRRTHYHAKIEEARATFGSAQDAATRASLQQVMDGYEQLILRLDRTERSRLERLP